MIVCLSLGLEIMIEKALQKKLNPERKQVNVKVDQAELTQRGDGEENQADVQVHAGGHSRADDVPGPLRKKDIM